jgi:hypothetical protein
VGDKNRTGFTDEELKAINTMALDMRKYYEWNTIRNDADHVWHGLLPLLDSSTDFTAECWVIAVLTHLKRQGKI